MDIEAIRRYCLTFPHATENIQWGSDLCFKVDGKLFVVAAMEPGPVRLCFKCTPESFAEFCERPGIRPAPYMARAQWVALEQFNSLSDSELREAVAESYRLVWERLPKRRRLELQNPAEMRRPLKSNKAKAAAKSKRAKAGK